MTTSLSVVARSSLHSWHAANGARFATSDGWQLPIVYSSLDREMTAARSGVALADISAFAKTAFQGPGVPALARDLLGESPALKSHGVAPFPAGSPTLACRLTEEHLLLLATSPSAAVLVNRVRGQSVVQSDVTSSYAGLAVIGPHTEELLRRVTHFDVAPAAFPVGSCAETALAGVQALLVRPPALALAAVHIYVAWDLGECVWERLLDAGRSFGITPLGLDGWRSLALAAAATRP